MSKGKILITGGTGLIGTKLQTMLDSSGYECHVLSRNPSKDNEYSWDLDENKIDLKAFKGVDTIIHLAGAKISSKRWTESRKKVLIKSRTEGPDLIFKTIQEHEIKIEHFISASGINIYDFESSDDIKDEQSKIGNSFIHECVQRWEEAADQFKSLAKVSKLRTGLVLSENGGALNVIEKPIRYYFGAPLGSGRQWVPWVHIEDVCRAYIYLIENQLEGTYNLTADMAVTNKEMTKKIAKKLKRPLWPIVVPSWLLKLFLGEMSVLVLKGYRTSNAKLIKTGFNFKYETFDEAINAVYEK